MPRFTVLLVEESHAEASTIFDISQPADDNEQSRKSRDDCRRRLQSIPKPRRRLGGSYIRGAKKHLTARKVTEQRASESPPSHCLGDPTSSYSTASIGIGYRESGLKVYATAKSRCGSYNSGKVTRPCHMMFRNALGRGL